MGGFSTNKLRIETGRIRKRRKKVYHKRPKKRKFEDSYKIIVDYLSSQVKDVPEDKNILMSVEVIHAETLVAKLQIRHKEVMAVIRKLIQKGALSKSWNSAPHERYEGCSAWSATAYHINKDKIRKEIMA